MNIFLVWKLLSAVRGPPTAVFRPSSGPPTAVFRSNLDRRQQFSDQIWIADSSFQTKFWIADSSFQTHGSYLVFKLSLWGQFSQKPGMLRIEWPIPLRRARSELSYGPACQKGFTSPLNLSFSQIWLHPRLDWVGPPDCVRGCHIRPKCKLQMLTLIQLRCFWESWDKCLATVQWERKGGWYRNQT